jgi:hypothetical protein
MANVINQKSIVVKKIRIGLINYMKSRLYDLITE